MRDRPPIPDVAAGAGVRSVEVSLLGGFAVVVDGRPVPAASFPQRRAADLVKVLALARAHRLTREEVVEALWPHLDGEAGTANLHKAAHYARRALGFPEAVVLRRGLVELAPGAAITTDVERFEDGDDGAYGGELLPEDRYEEWTAPARERLRGRRLKLLRDAGRWREILTDDPGDEGAHAALMRQHAERGDLAAATRQFRVLREELARLGLVPSPEIAALHDELCRGRAVCAPPAHDGPMVGRREQLATATRAVVAADGGRGGALLVVGDAGMGKTRFVDAVAAAGAERGWHVLRAGAREAEGRTPYRPLAEAIEPLLVERPDLAARLSEQAQRVLALLSPAALAPPGEGARGQEVLSALGRLLAVAAQERGVAIALEDLHVSDDATLRVLQYLIGAARRERMLIVLSARAAEGGPALVDLRRRLLEQRAAVEVEMGRLDPAALREIAARVAPDGVRDATLADVVEAAAGNPFFAEELAAAANPEGGVRVPDGLEDLLDARLDRFERAAPGLLPIVSVLDDGWTLEDVRAIGSGDRDHVAAALAAGTRTGVLERSVEERWRFRHPLLRDRARRRVPTEELAAAHGDAADRLAAAGAPPERIASHLLQCGREREAVPLLREAAAAASQVGAYGDGERWVELALRHAPGEERATLLELLGDLRRATGDARAPAAYASARATAPGERMPALWLKEARALLVLGELVPADRALDAAGDDPGLRREILLVRGMIAWHRGDFEEARRCADGARTPAGRHAEADDALYDLEAMLAHADGHWERTMTAQLADAWRTPQLAGRVLDAYLCVTEYVLHGGDPADRLIDFARRVHAQAKAAGARRGVAFAATVLGEAHLLVGDAETARRHLHEAVRASHETGAVGGESLARARLGQALAVLGEGAAARAHLEEAVDLAYASTLTHHLLFLVQAPLVLLPEDPEDAIVLVDRAEALLETRPACRFCPLEYYVAASTVCARAGEQERGWAFLARAEDSAARFSGASRAAAVAEARGTLLLAEGDAGRAEVSLLRAAEGYALVGHRLDESRVRRTLAAHA